MNTTCPRIVNRWLSTEKVIKWFKIHRLELLAHIESKQPASASPRLWWASLLAMRQFMSHTTIAFRSIQGLMTLLEQQQATLNDLVAYFIDDVGVTGPLTTESIGNLDTSTMSLIVSMPSLYPVSKSFWVVWLLGWTHFIDWRSRCCRLEQLVSGYWPHLCHGLWLNLLNLCPSRSQQ
jgi:hypothetical protein